MKLVGLMPVRNEDWCLGLSARVVLQWCDELVVTLHACAERSHYIMREVFHETQRVRFIHSFDPMWDEMRQREIMLMTARQDNATHIAMIDADEVLSANLLEPDIRIAGESRVRGFVSTLSPGQMLELPGYNLRGSLDRYHANGIWGNRWFSCAFKDQPEAHWAGDKFHSRKPAGVKWQNWRPIQQGEGGILHLWGASERRLRAKHALYKVVERLRFERKSVAEIDHLYNLWRSEADVTKYYNKLTLEPAWTYARVPVKSWWAHRLGPGEHPIDSDGEPWQIAEVQRLVAEHGRDRFAGLDLFGVV